MFSAQGVRLVELGDLYFDVSLLLWCCGLVWMTQQGLCSAYVPMLLVAFPLATKLLLAKEFKHRGKRPTSVSLYGIRLFESIVRTRVLFFHFWTLWFMLITVNGFVICLMDATV